MKSILEQRVKCPFCGWDGTVDEAAPDIDGDGSLGCIECLDQHDERVPVEFIESV